ncbi:MAG: AAA family ATPase [Fibrobacter sp.]|nr:AAA family ATPase [Fibrobacter sp.]
MAVDVFTCDGISEDGEQVSVDSVVNAELDKNLPWVERYRGHDLDSIILPEHVEKQFRSAFKFNQFNNYILYSGPSGTGKTSLARAIPEMLGTPYLFLYGKRDSEILADIEEYAQYSSGNGMPRFVVIDEADGARLPVQFYRALQSLIEGSASTLRFVLTCNDFFRIPNAVKSRCSCIEFTAPDVENEEYKKRVFKRLMYIARTETSAVGGTVDKNTVAKIMYNYAPDIRSMIQVMYNTFNENDGSIVGEPVALAHDSVAEIFELVTKFDAKGLYRYLSENISFCQSVYVPFGDYAVDQLPDTAMIPFGISLAKALERSTKQVDQMYALWGFLLEVMQIIHATSKDWKWVKPNV